MIFYSINGNFINKILILKFGKDVTFEDLKKMFILIFYSHLTCPPFTFSSTVTNKMLNLKQIRKYIY